MTTKFRDNLRNKDTVDDLIVSLHTAFKDYQDALSKQVFDDAAEKQDKVFDIMNQIFEMNGVN